MLCELYKISGWGGTYVLRIFGRRGIVDGIKISVPTSPIKWFFIDEQMANDLLKKGYISEDQYNIFLSGDEFTPNWFLAVNTEDGIIFSNPKEEGDYLIVEKPKPIDKKQERTFSIFYIIMYIIAFLILASKILSS